jgi:hypothetical protein
MHSRTQLRRALAPLLFLAAAALACATVLGGPTPEPQASAAWQATVDDMAALTGGLEFPEHFQQENAARTGEEFDPNEYFAVLTHLSMEPGYALDYVYHFDGMGGFPILYVRPADQPRYETAAEYEQAAVEDDYLNHVQTDGTPEGFFELALLRIMGGQFYLWWHAGYNDARIVADPARIETVLAETESFCGEMEPGVKRSARRLSVEPAVIPWQDDVTVRVTEFSAWGGFTRRSFVFAKAFPHRLLDSDSETQVEYMCPVVF